MTKRGASTASCMLIPKAVRFRKTCSMAWGCRSPPGPPKGMANSPRRIASAGFGVSRGRLPGATQAVWSRRPQLCEPRDEGTKPRPGTIGLS